MTAFAEALIERVRHAQAALSEARSAGDDHLVDTLTFDLADLEQLAARNGVSLDLTTTDPATA